MRRRVGGPRAGPRRRHPPTAPLRARHARSPGARDALLTHRMAPPAPARSRIPADFMPDFPFGLILVPDRCSSIVESIFGEMQS
jgi:hypothetical protein